MTLHKLKVAALQHEQREDWPAAIELYRQAIREAEGGPEGGDPSLYNRVGDLSHKAGNDVAACEAWEQAVHRYADLGFLNSAIALCGKILRVDHQRLHTYLELARLQGRKRVLYDVRQNLKIYLDQMAAAGRADAAHLAVVRLGDEFPGWRELDLLLDELLGRERAPDAPEPTTTAAGGSARALVFLDTAPLQIERASEPPVAANGADTPTSVAVDLELDQRPDTAPPAVPLATGNRKLDGLVGVEQTARELTSLDRVEGLDTLVSVAPMQVAPLEGLQQTSLAPPPGPPEPAAAEPAAAAAPIGGTLVFIPPEAPVAAEAAQVDAGPTAGAAADPLANRVAAEELLDQGDRSGAIAELDRSLLVYQEQEEWLHAYRVATELTQAEPRAIGRHQARVELASRLRDPALLCEAYVDLGDALVREGSADKGVAVYRRVLELNETNPRARAALRAMAPDAPSAEVDSGFIDLGAELIDDHPRSTRMRTEMPAVAPDEDETFRDALAEFRRALDQNLPIEDHQAHYDLGIAFKEMGLLDEAISEFQKALRAPEVRLRTSEALGEVFFEQGRPAVAEAVLRGVENSAEGDAEKIGVLYWLGRALDAQGRHHDAISYYQRIIAVDVSFRDAGDRLTQVHGDVQG